MERAAVMKNLRLTWSGARMVCPPCTGPATRCCIPASHLLAPVIALITSAFLVQYRLIPIGIGLGLPPLYALCAATSIEAGIFLGIYGILDTAGQTSKRVAWFLEKTKNLAERSKMFDRYGILGLFPCEILIGVYLCAPAFLVIWVAAGTGVCHHHGRVTAPPPLPPRLPPSA